LAPIFNDAWHHLGAVEFNRFRCVHANQSAKGESELIIISTKGSIASPARGHCQHVVWLGINEPR
jgi:hypothetical protein